MKITVSQLRKIIREEVEKVTEAKPKSSLGKKIKLGDIFKNPTRNQISVEFLENGYAGWELLSKGRSKSLDGTVEELQKQLTDGGYEFDRNEMGS